MHRLQGSDTGLLLTQHNSYRPSSADDWEDAVDMIYKWHHQQQVEISATVLQCHWMTKRSEIWHSIQQALLRTKWKRHIFYYDKMDWTGEFLLFYLFDEHSKECELTSWPDKHGKPKWQPVWYILRKGLQSEILDNYFYWCDIENSKNNKMNDNSAGLLWRDISLVLQYKLPSSTSGSQR